MRTPILFADRVGFLLYPPLILPMHQSVLLRCGIIALFEASDQVAAVRKAGLIGNCGQVVIREQQQVFSLAQAYEFNILFAALAILAVKDLGKIGIAHVAHFGELGNIDVFVRVPVNIYHHIFN